MRAGLVVSSALLALSPVGPARAQQLVLEPAADVSIYGDTVDNASGVDPLLYVGATQFNTLRRCLLRFDLSPLPAAAVVSAVSLSVVVERAQGDPAPEILGLHRITTAWGEGPASPSDPGAGGLGTPAVAGDVTWIDATFPDDEWTMPGGDFLATPSATQSVGAAGTTATFSGPGMIADVVAWRATPSTNHGWIVVGDEANAFNARRLHSGEATNAVVRPRLTITYSVPATPADRWFVY